MDEQKPLQPQQAAPPQEPGSSPRLLSEMKGWIAGVTALVVALGGLATATRGVIWDKDKPAAQSVKAEAPEKAAEAADQPADAAEAEVEDPAYYDTDEGGSLRFVDGLWVETDKAGTKYRYDEISNDGTMTVAIDRGGGEGGSDVYLRWPNWGGQAQKSWDRQYTWSDVYNVTPPEPAA